MKYFLLSLLFSTFVSYTQSVGCNCVAMRMDDIQDWWLTQTQIDVIDVFKNSNTPLTSVIIGKDFGDDSSIVNAIKNYLSYSSTSGWDFEVGNHGWQHDDFTTLSAATQSSWLQQARTKTLGVLSGYVTNSQFKSFVPPYNAFNSGTISAAKANGFTIFSAGVGEYGDAGRSFPGNDPSFREWPMQAATTDLSDTYKISSTESFQMIKDQIAANGYSTLMMHFVEFSNGDGTTNQAAINDLKNLITLIKNAGITITNLRGLEALYFGTSPPPPVSPATTGKAVPATTGKAAPVTTGKAAPVTTGKAAPVTTSKAASGAAPPSTTGKTSPPPTSSKQVAFKFEQVQDWWQTAPAAAVLNAFKTAGVPLSIGIIPKQFGEDTSIVNPIKTALSSCNPRVEIAANGFNFENLKSKSLAQQSTIFANAKAQVKKVLGVTPTSFFPPGFYINSNTDAALATNGFVFVNSYTDSDPAPWSRNNPSVWHFPAGASTFNTDDSSKRYTGAQTWSQALTQLNNYNFAVIELTPNEYTQDNTDNTVNTTMINELVNLLNLAKNSGYSLVLTSEMATPFGGPVSTATCKANKRSLEDNEVEAEAEVEVVGDNTEEDQEKKTIKLSYYQIAAIVVVAVVATVAIIAVVMKTRAPSKAELSGAEVVDSGSESEPDTDEDLVKVKFATLNRRTSSAVVNSKA